VITVVIHRVLDHGELVVEIEVGYHYEIVTA